MQDKQGTMQSTKEGSTLNRIEERDQRKMDEMRKKLHTDDEGNKLQTDIYVEIDYNFL